MARLANPRKNIDGVLRAVALVRGKIDVGYEIVGEGPLRAEYEAPAQRLGLRDRVRFLGALDGEQLVEAYHRADLFVLATRVGPRDVEGFGIVYLEASACGTPVLCAPGSGAADAISERENGLMARSAQPGAIADAILRFERDRDRYAPERVRAFADGFRWPGSAHRLWTEMQERL